MIEKLKILFLIGLVIPLLTACEEAADKFDFDENGNWILSFFSSCICIGDSVTEGGINDYPLTPPKGTVDKDSSYPAELAKLTGWAVENAGISGINASQWWENEFGKYDYSQYEIALIELGYNAGLEDNFGEDYCKIIEGVQAQNPDIKIILIISSQMFDNANKLLRTCREVILQTSAKYGLPVIDLTDKSFIDLNADIYHGKVDSSGKVDMVHFNAFGYCAKANLIRHALTDILRDSVNK